MNVERGGRVTRRHIQLRSIIHTTPQRFRKRKVSVAVIEGSQGAVCRSRGGVVDVVAEIDASSRARVVYPQGTSYLVLPLHARSTPAIKNEDDRLLYICGSLHVSPTVNSFNEIGVSVATTR